MYDFYVPSLSGLNLDFDQIMANLPPEVQAQLAAEVSNAAPAAPVAAMLPEPAAYVPGMTPALQQAAPMMEGPREAIDAEAFNAMDGVFNRNPNAATTPNYLVRPTSGLDPLSLALQEIDGQRGFQFVTNKGNAAGVAGKMASTKGAMGVENPTGFVPLVEGATYRIRNERGDDQIVYTGTGEEGLRQVYALAQGLSADRGKKANWGVEMQLPGEQGWRRVADDDPAKSLISKVGKVVGTALPLAVSLVPGLQVLGPVASSIVAGGAGAALAGRDPLKGAIMSGAGALGGEVLGKALEAGGALGTNLAANAASAVGTGIGTTAGGLITGQNLQNSLLGGVAAGGLSYLGGELMKPGGPLSNADATGTGGGITGNTGGGVPSDGAINVIGARPINLGGASASLSQFAPGLANGAQRLEELQQQANQQALEQQFDDIVVTGRPSVSTPSVVAPVTPSAPNFAVPDVGSQFPATEVTAPKPVETPSVPVPVTPTAPATEAPKELTEEEKLQQKVKDLASYLRLAGLGIGLLGGAAGGGSSGSNRIPAGLGSGGTNPVFSAKLPTANLPGLAGGARTAADLGGQGLQTPQDWYRYGYGPEQSFRSNIPTAPRNTSTAYTGYAEGGYAVGGPGDGRDDEIPAMLSDGEYVIDAETVALLGNGSNKAGADMLDQFRVNIRKHKGRKLAKGDFSHDAKKPEKYLTKGRSRG